MTDDTTDGAERRADSTAGQVIVSVDLVGTALFAVTAVVAAIVFTTTVQWIAAITAITLFFIGIGAFLWSFWNAVQRSRGEQVAVTQLYLLIAGVAPPDVRRSMWFALAVQVVVGLVTALSRPSGDDGSPGTSLALGVLVPVFGFGLNGLWAAYHGTYAVRAVPEDGRATTTGKDVDHG